MDDAEKKLKKRRSLKDIGDWTSLELFEEIMERLKEKKYDEMRCMIYAAREDDLNDIFLELFPALIMEYDDVLMRNDDNSSKILKEIIKLVKAYGSAKHTLLVLMECTFRVESWKAFMMIGKFMEEFISETNTFKTRANDDIINDYLPLWVVRFTRDNVNYSEDDDEWNANYFDILEADYMNKNNSITIPMINESEDSDDCFVKAVSMFLRLYSLSRSTNCKLLDEFVNQVLSCRYIKSHILESYIEELNWMCKYSKKPLMNTLILVNSLKSKSSTALPQIFSPEYRLKLAIKPLQHSLHISTANMYNVGYVVLVLRNYLDSVKSESIERNQITFFLDFLSNLLICCEEQTLCEVRVKCMEAFALFLTKFEPVAQVLLIRRLFFLVRTDGIKRKMLCESSRSIDDGLLQFVGQILAWLIDLFRYKLRYEAFRRELGFFWGDIATVEYDSFGIGLRYYTALFVLAQQQALQKINHNLMLNVWNHYLVPMQPRISEWTKLIKRPIANIASCIEAAQLKGYQQMEEHAMPMIHFQYLQTLQFVETFIGDGFQGYSEEWY